ncbi:MAG: phage tail protein [Clostridia bacterium]|nr:phage tail protein [Clostridia bacterium]
MIRSPLLLDRQLNPISPVAPVALRLTRQLRPLSGASLTVKSANVEPRSFVELFDRDGSAGVFRVTGIVRDSDGLTEATLQHGLCTLSDHMHPGEETRTGSLRTLVTRLLSNQDRWVLGDCEVPDDQELTWTIKHSNDLESLLDLMNEVPEYHLETDQSALPWVLHIRKLPDKVRCECRLERNLSDVTIEEDASDMCTRAYADGLDAPIDADTIGKWGVIARRASVDKDLGKDFIRDAVQRYVEKAKNPRLTITLTALQLSALTGEPFDAFHVGDLCRCVLPDMTAVQRIVTIEQPDPIGEPMHAVLTLASTQEDMSATVAGLVVDIRMQRLTWEQLDRQLRIEADAIDFLAQEIELKATKTEVDGVSTRIGEAEILLNKALGELALKASYTDLDKEINTVSLRLDAVNSLIEAKADLVRVEALETQITGLVTIEELEALQGYVDEMITESMSVNTIVGGHADFDDIVCGQLNGGTAATQEWVNGKGFMTDLPSNAATQAWVLKQGYATTAVTNALAARIAALEA